MEKADYQYEVLPGIGRPAKLINSTEPIGNGTEAGIEEAYISLLDVTEDTGKPDSTASEKEEPKPADIAPAFPNSSRPPQEEASTTGRKELPWTRSSCRIKSPSLRLHNEIVEFCRFLEPTPEEDAVRQDALRRITEVVQSMYPRATVSIFGSYVTGLYLPTSDMDVVVINSGCTDIPRALRGIGNLLVERGMGKEIQVIAAAKVPIIKFDDVQSGLAFDISFDVANGPKTAKLVAQLMGTLPPMRHLVIVLKLFLQQREMNEVYQGGIGSYALLVMVANFLLQHRSRMPKKANRNPTLECNLGVLLLDFFRLYGRALKQEEVAISCRNGGSYFSKQEHRQFLQREREHFLAIEDPQDPDNDLARGSWNILKVQKAFEFAYRQLSNPIDPSDSNLERIIRLDAVLMSRAPASESSAQPMAQPQAAQPNGIGQDADMAANEMAEEGGPGEQDHSAGRYMPEPTTPFKFRAGESPSPAKRQGRGFGQGGSPSPAKRQDKKAKRGNREQPSPAHKKKKKVNRERDFDFGEQERQKRRRS